MILMSMIYYDGTDVEFLIVAQLVTLHMVSKYVYRLMKKSFGRAKR